MLNEHGRAHKCFPIFQNTVKWFIRCEGRKCTFSEHLLRWMEVDRILCKVKCPPCWTRRCATAAVSSVRSVSAAEPEVTLLLEQYAFKDWERSGREVCPLGLSQDKPDGWALSRAPWRGVSSAALQADFYLCPILLPLLPFRRCGSLNKRFTPQAPPQLLPPENHPITSNICMWAF